MGVDNRRAFLKLFQNTIKRDRQDIRYQKKLLREIGAKNLPTDQVKGMKRKIKELNKEIESCIRCKTTIRRYTKERKKR